MKRILLAAILGAATLGTGIEAREILGDRGDQGDCQRVRGSIVDTIIPSNDALGRVLGIVNGTLNGASTAYVTGQSADGLIATSADVFVTKKGDILTATGDVTFTPIGNSSTDLTEAATLTITGGTGEYSGSAGTIKLEGRATFDSTGGGTFDLVYRGTICGPNLEHGRH
jgi:hypothetical protein